MDNNGQQSAVLHASLMPLLLQVCSPTCNVEGKTLLPGDQQEFQVLKLFSWMTKSDFLLHSFCSHFQTAIKTPSLTSQT